MSGRPLYPPPRPSVGPAQTGRQLRGGQVRTSGVRVAWVRRRGVRGAGAALQVDDVALEEAALARAGARVRPHPARPHRTAARQTCHGGHRMWRGYANVETLAGIHNSRNRGTVIKSWSRQYKSERMQLVPICKNDIMTGTVTCLIRLFVDVLSIQAC